jgi:hypothetical protein
MTRTRNYKLIQFFLKKKLRIQNCQINHIHFKVASKINKMINIKHIEIVKYLKFIINHL